MTNDDKALVEVLRSMSETCCSGGCYACSTEKEAADRIEALSAEVERLNAVVADRLLGSSVDHRTLKDVLAENERLREALTRIAIGDGIGGSDAELQCADIARAALGEQQ